MPDLNVQMALLSEWGRLSHERDWEICKYLTGSHVQCRLSWRHESRMYAANMIGLTAGEAIHLALTEYARWEKQNKGS